MKRLLPLLTGILIMAACSSCEKKCHQLNYCSVWHGDYYPSIIGYFAPDVDTQIILQYKPDGLFDQRLDSSCYINTEVTGGHISNESDTQRLIIRYTGGTYNSQRINDFRLVLPGVRSYSFTEVMVDGDFSEDEEFKCSMGASGCYRHVTSMKIDGVYRDLSDYNSHLVLYK